MTEVLRPLLTSVVVCVFVCVALTLNNAPLPTCFAQIVFTLLLVMNSIFSSLSFRVKRTTVLFAAGPPEK